MKNLGHEKGSEIMKIQKIDRTEGRIVIKPEIIEDLWTIERVLFENDLAKSRTLRKFKANDRDEGEMKEVVVTVKVEKVAFDKTSERVRISGKIVEGRPLEFIRLNSYHTINIGIGDVLEIKKEVWPEYLIKIVNRVHAGRRRGEICNIRFAERRGHKQIAEKRKHTQGVPAYEPIS